jgi:Zn finger protein HypA/HybF involved in hydrogenase expression
MADLGHPLHGADVFLPSGLMSGTDVSMEGERLSLREKNIASAIVDAAQAEAICLGGARLVRMGIRVGADCAIDLGVLEEALRVVRHGTDMEETVVHLMSSPRQNVCHDCGSNYLSARAEQSCPSCGSPESELVMGDELEISFIEVERP